MPLYLLWAGTLADGEVARLVAFLRTLTGENPQQP